MNMHWQRVKRRLRGACLLLFALLFVSVPAAGRQSETPFVKTSGTMFTLDGGPFFVTGVNNHYLTFASKNEVTRVLDDAVAMGANVVRVILQPVIGSRDGSVPTVWNWRNPAADASNLGVGHADLLYWDSKKNAMAVDDGPNGMQKVDFLVARAGERHLKLIIAFLDFWDYTGGAQQMRAWYGSTDKSTFFFSDPRTKRDYRAWVEHVVRRLNPLTGLAYRDDPTIMAWELMNEGNAQPESLRMDWTAEMSAYVKSLDPNHLVSSGNANVEPKLADLTIPTLDFGTWHGYPLYFGLTTSQFDKTITEYCQIAGLVRKPVLLEEFGYARSNRDSAEAYAGWLDTLARDPDCGGWLVWRLVSLQDHGRYPLDEHDQFDIHNDASPIWNVLKAATARAAQIRESSGASANSLRKTP
jgi:mannan endo-1,4-beta-mannosidase